MPTPREGEERNDFVSRCIPIVIDDQDLDADSEDDRMQAVAICNSMWREARETRTTVMPFHEEDAVVSIGGSVKAVGDGRTQGWLVEFTDPTRPDLEADYFDGTTEYGPHVMSLAFYHHGADKTLGRRALSHPAMIAVKDTGVWMEHQLDMRDEYEAAIYRLAEQGKLGLSSGTAPHLVEREQKGDVYHIKRWYLGLDASYTPTPANWASRVMPLKSYIKSVGDIAQLGDDISQDELPDQDGKAKDAEASAEAVARRRGLGQAEALAFELSTILED